MLEVVALLVDEGDVLLGQGILVLLLDPQVVEHGQLLADGALLEEGVLEIENGNAVTFDEEHDHQAHQRVTAQAGTGIEPVHAHKEEQKQKGDGELAGASVVALVVWHPTGYGETDDGQTHGPEEQRGQPAHGQALGEELIEGGAELDGQIMDHDRPDGTVKDGLCREIAALPEKQGDSGKTQEGPHPYHQVQMGKEQGQRHIDQAFHAKTEEQAETERLLFPQRQEKEKGGHPQTDQGQKKQNRKAAIHQLFPPTYSVRAVRKAVRLRRLISSSVPATTTISRRTSATWLRLTRYQWLQRTKW